MTVPRRALPVLIALAAVAALPGCGRSKADSMLVRESFSSEDTYSRKVAVAPAAACEAARRALLSQGYGIARADAAAVEGSKNFQPSEETHEQLNLRVSCVAQGDDKAWIFVSAVQDRYALKKSATSASVGVGVLGSVSLPVGSSNDSMVRVASSTVQDGDFYRRFFERLDMYLPKAAPATDKDVQGQRDPPPAVPAAAPVSAPAAVPAIVPTPAPTPAPAPADGGSPAAPTEAPATPVQGAVPPTQAPTAPVSATAPVPVPAPATTQDPPTPR